MSRNSRFFCCNSWKKRDSDLKLQKASNPHHLQALPKGIGWKVKKNRLELFKIGTTIERNSGKPFLEVSKKLRISEEHNNAQ